MIFARTALVLLLVLGIGLPVELSSSSSKPASLRVLCPEGMERVPGTDLCTHGPDNKRGRNPSDQPALVNAPRAARLADTLSCTGDGTSGPRIQVVYAVPQGTTSRHATVAPSIQAWVAEMDALVLASAEETGGVRHLRLVHDAECLPVVPEVRTSTASSTDFGAMIRDLKAKGYSRTDRHYVIFADARTYCGIGTVSGTDVAPGYGRTDTGCWGAWAALHELFHNLGAVNNLAPNASGGWHCIDEFDVMCYSDDPYYPDMQYECVNRSDNLLDCNHDDYFHTNPPLGNYLASNWNTASSGFLSAGVSPPPPPPPAIPTPIPPTAVPPDPQPTAEPAKKKKKKGKKKNKGGKGHKRGKQDRNGAGR